MTNTIHNTKIKTVIYTPTGYFGSDKLWNNASYAFKNDNSSWQYLGNNTDQICIALNCPIEALPQYDYEYSELKDWEIK